MTQKTCDKFGYALVPSIVRNRGRGERRAGLGTATLGRPRRASDGGLLQLVPAHGAADRDADLRDSHLRQPARLGGDEGARDGVGEVVVPAGPVVDAVPA